MKNTKNHMIIVFIGHVDHGKSTIIGRLLADSGNLPEGKLKQIKNFCEKTKKDFEYSFLLDALKDEQDQGITIDAARIHYKTEKRNYLILDAPGHIEFLKNMITGAAAAEAALLIIDAKEGIQENSRRHGFMVSFLGIKKIIVVVNKLDLVNYSQEVFKNIKQEFSNFLKEINIEPLSFIPVSGKKGDNVVNKSKNTPWYNDLTLIQTIDNFEKDKITNNLPFRFPVQDIYKFTENSENKRFFAGTISSGKINVGDEIVFLPSKKKSKIASIEGFNIPKMIEVGSGTATGFTLTEQVYVKPGELMCKSNEKMPEISHTFKANIFWISKKPMIKNKKYKLKFGPIRSSVYLTDIYQISDASDLSSVKNKQQIDRHDVAECLFKSLKPIPFDLEESLISSCRFVIIDDYFIAGGGIILENSSDKNPIADEFVVDRNFAWENSKISSLERNLRFSQKAKFIIISGADNEKETNTAKFLEEKLFHAGYNVYYLGISNILHGLNNDLQINQNDRDEQIRRLGELAFLFTNAGMIFVSNIPQLDDSEIEILRTLNQPNEIIVINIGDNQFNSYQDALNIKTEANVIDITNNIKNHLINSEVVLDFVI